ncbi:DMT family transporter [Corynebacterium freiburgense]|uniref:DMT family transporter n=1 Tax=Corynebacterium freiburgense TaxID=556548 RepID=UPI000428158D|nr:multidrug efflux SMR transporter [Corynebacterium freiburgense]WJZ01407.1 Multidrug transporter EmrE [Corynebacterium freiburgense]
MAWVWLIGAITAEGVATMSLRASNGMQKKYWMILVFLGYAFAFLFLAQALAIGMPVGIAYGVWAACGVVLTALLARIMFRDPLTPRMGVGFLCIATGVLLINLG